MADMSVYRRIDQMPWGNLGEAIERGNRAGAASGAGYLAGQGRYGDAATALFPYDPQAAAGYLKMRDYEDERQKRKADEDFSRTIGGKLATGDRTAMVEAKNEAYKTGRLETGGQIQAIIKQADTEALQRAQRIYEEAYADIEGLDALPREAQGPAYETIRQKYPDAGLPAQWGPNVSRAMRVRVLGAKEALEAELLARKPTIVGDGDIAVYADGRTFENRKDFAPRAERGASGDATDAGMNAQQFSRANTLRDEFTQQTANYRTVEALADRSRKYVQSGTVSPMQDIGLVYALAKVYDPTSVVREAEFATVASAGGLGARFKNLVSQAQGRGFDPATRAELLKAIEQSATSVRDERNRISQEYARRASQLGIDPQFVVDDLAQSQPMPSPSPGAGSARFPPIPNKALGERPVQGQTYTMPGGGLGTWDGRVYRPGGQ